MDGETMAELDERLRAAAEAVREHELLTRRAADVRRTIAAAEREVAQLGTTLAAERHDVARLEGLTLARVLAALQGTRDDAVAREKAEADAAAYRLAEAQARLKAARLDLQSLTDRAAQLADAPKAYQALIDEKERTMAATDPRTARLAELAQMRGRLTADLREAGEARTAALRAAQALDEVADVLQSASNWSTYDTFFGGGMLSSSIKHDRLEQAAKAASRADRTLTMLRAELADLGDGGLTAPSLHIDGTTRFLDIWFDNIFTDLAVRDQVKRAQATVDAARTRVQELRSRLDQRIVADEARLAEAEAERQALLTAA
ncbi:MAG: hypothetical protein HOV79_05865 [Hamadaea sp.]|nr:hypothetical protein [Hamadaea sp.]